MASQSSDRRPRLRDIVSGVAADFNKTWNETEASSGFDPLQGHRIKMGVFHKIGKSRHSD